MYLVVYDTSAPGLALGIFRIAGSGPRLIAARRRSMPARHSETLVPELRALLAEARVPLSRIRYMAVGDGPGSFTGLRVGATTAKFLCFALGWKLVRVSSFEAHALGGASRAGQVAVACDARKGKLYAALYEKMPDREWKCRMRPSLMSMRAFTRRVKGPCLLIGDMAVDWRAQSPRASVLHAAPGRWGAPNVHAMARLAWRSITAGQFEDPGRFEPCYLHPRDCNVVKKKPERTAISVKRLSLSLI